MKIKGPPMSVDFFLPLHKATYLAKASQASVDAGTAVTVLTYLHGVKEAMDALAELGEDYGVDLIELTSLKPLDMDTIKESLARTNRLIILDESTKSGGVGATISARVAEEAFDLLDQPVQRYFRAARLVYYPFSVHAHSNANRGMLKLLGISIGRLCMADAPVPYSTAIEKMVVKRCSDLVAAVQNMVR